MKFNRIEIKPSGLKRDLWDVHYTDIPGDRVQTPGQKPSANGYYYYPETETINLAFEKLKQTMIKRHLNEIFKLQKSLGKLIEVQLPDSLKEK